MKDIERLNKILLTKDSNKKVIRLGEFQLTVPTYCSEWNTASKEIIRLQDIGFDFI